MDKVLRQGRVHRRGHSVNSWFLPQRHGPGLFATSTSSDHYLWLVALFSFVFVSLLLSIRGLGTLVHATGRVPEPQPNFTHHKSIADSLRSHSHHSINLARPNGRPSGIASFNHRLEDSQHATDSSLEAEKETPGEDAQEQPREEEAQQQAQEVNDQETATQEADQQLEQQQADAQDQEQEQQQEDTVEVAEQVPEEEPQPDTQEDPGQQVDTQETDPAAEDIPQEETPEILETQEQTPEEEQEVQDVGEQVPEEEDTQTFVADEQQSEDQMEEQASMDAQQEEHLDEPQLEVPQENLVVQADDELDEDYEWPEVRPVLDAYAAWDAQRATGKRSSSAGGLVVETDRELQKQVRTFMRQPYYVDEPYDELMENGVGVAGTSSGRKQVDLFVGIFTPASADEEHKKRRAALRDTWLPALAALDSVDHAFVVGRPSNDKHAASIRKEAKRDGGPFMFVDAQECDTCHNDKTIAFLLTVHKYYDARYIIRVEDNIYLNPARLLRAAPQWDTMHADYVGCMHAPGVPSEATDEPFEDQSALLGQNYFWHAQSSIYAVSGDAVDRYIAPSASMLRTLSTAEATLGLWLLTFNTTFFEDPRLCQTRCDKSSVAIWNPRGTCKGLCDPEITIPRYHTQSQCTDVEAVKRPLGLIPAQPWKGHEIYGLMQQMIGVPIVANDRDLQAKY